MSSKTAASLLPLEVDSLYYRVERDDLLKDISVTVDSAGITGILGRSHDPVQVFGIVGTLTVEELYRDQRRFQEKVRDEAHIDLEGMGFEFRSFVFQAIQDDEGYLNALGQPKIQEALKRARIATANADRDAKIEEESASGVAATLPRISKSAMSTAASTDDCPLRSDFSFSMIAAARNGSCPRSPAVPRRGSSWAAR